jgi:hypothetical protein
VNDRSEQEELIVRYFFGELSEDEEARVDEKFLSDNQFFEQMLAVEDALIDSYVQGELSDVDRKKVEEALLSSPRQVREVKFVKDLIMDLARAKASHENPEVAGSTTQSSRLRSLMALIDRYTSRNRLKFALLLMLVFSISLTIWNSRLRNRLIQSAADQNAIENRDRELRQHIDNLSEEMEAERSKNEDLQQRIATFEGAVNPIDSSDVALLFLTANSLSRGSGELPVVHIPPNANRLQISIEINKDNMYKSYSASIRTFDFRDIWSGNHLRVMRTNPIRIVLTLPAKLFADEHYNLTLKGQSDDRDSVDIGDYSFRVKR